MRNLNEQETYIVNNLFEHDAEPIYTNKEWEELKAFIKSIPATKHPNPFFTESDIKTAKMVADGIMCKMLEIEYRRYSR